MSQLFDSLRRGRQPQARVKTPRTAHGDAVLATLGYAPVRRLRHASSLLRSAAVVLVIAAIWAGWRLYYTPGSAVSVRHGQSMPSAARRSAPLPQAQPTRESASQSATGSPLPTHGAPLPSAGSALPAATPHRTEPSPTATTAEPAAKPPARPTVPRAAPAVTQAAAPRQPVPPAVAPMTRPSPVPSPATGARTAPNDLDLALYYHRAGDFENALQHYRALLEKNELNAQAHNNLGLLYQERNLLQESARELQRAVLIEPRSASAHNNYGVTLLMQGRPDEAEAEFRSVLALDSRNVDALVNLALAERNRNQLDVAKDTLLKALTIAPRNAAAHYNLGQLYDQSNETARAIEHYRRFLETAGPEHAGRAAAVRARIAELSRTPE